MLHAATPFQLVIAATDLEPVALDEAEQGEKDLMWRKNGNGLIVAPFGGNPAATPASKTVTIPAAGEYQLWACYAVSENARLPFAILLGDQEYLFCEEPFGTPEEGHPEIFQGRMPDRESLLWTSQPVTLPAGDLDLQVTRTTSLTFDGDGITTNPPIVRTIVITNNPNATPADFSP